MKPLPLILIALVLLPAAVRAVEYPDEYYTLGKMYDDLYIKLQAPLTVTLSKETTMSALELRRHTILLEKQNELLEQQNLLLQAQLRLCANGTTECKTCGVKNVTATKTT